jgi:hypothetical protein
MVLQQSEHYMRCAREYNLAGNTRKQDRHSGENEKKLNWNSTLTLYSIPRVKKRRPFFYTLRADVEVASIKTFQKKMSFLS